MATHLVPEHGLSVTAEALRGSLSTFASGQQPSRAAQQLEAAIMVVEVGEDDPASYLPPKLPTHHHGDGGGEAHQFPLQAPILALTLTPPDASPQATVPALTDLAAQNPAAKDGLSTLLQQLMATKTPDPLAMSLVRGGAS